MDTKKMVYNGARQFITFWAFTCRKWAHGDLEIKKIYIFCCLQFLFWCHIFILFVQILFLGTQGAFTSWPMGLRLRSRLRFRLWVLHPHELHRRPTARCACFIYLHNIILIHYVIFAVLLTFTSIQRPTIYMSMCPSMRPSVAGIPGKPL